MATENHAVVLTWNGSTNNLFSEASNWNELDAPDGDDSLVFAGVVNTIVTNDLLAGIEVQGVEFSNTTNGENFTIAGNKIQLSGDIETEPVSDLSTDSIENTIGLDIELVAANVGINTGDGHSARVTGVISGSEQLDINNGSNARDDGIVTLAGSNTYTGGTRLMGGTLVVEDDSALGTGVLLMEDRSNRNPILSIGADGLTIGNEINFSNQGGSKTILFSLDGENFAELTGNLTLNDTGATNNRIAVGAEDTLVYSGVISGSE
ncbi:MAG: autotransporter-associated beta strand repeat-containing protein, partial [Verrucomicrobiota bacterium]